MATYQRTHHLGELREEHNGQEVLLAGWVHRRRDHGGIIFIDLRDKQGVTQIVFDPRENADTHGKAGSLRQEWVVAVRGKVVLRSPGMKNPRMATGSIEVEANELHILSQAETPPFSIADEEITVHEDLRLKYRYLDLRRGEIARNLALRHKAMMTIRRFLDLEKFTEVMTPILCKSTPEGARDYLVPSRIHPGQFYALPQSPQIFKQLLMIGGLERYFQIAPCFRDEDLRADRQPEFAQVDIELSFATPRMLMEIIERLYCEVFNTCIGVKLPTPFRELSYAHCLEHYGTDKPDLRFDMPLVRVDAIVKESNFTRLKEGLEQGGCVKALCVKGGADLSRAEIDKLTEFVGTFGLPGLAWMKKQSEGLTSNITKFFTEDGLKRLEHAVNAEVGDLILFGAEKESLVNQALDHLRRYLARMRGLIKEGQFAVLWVTDFPLLEYSAEEKRYQSLHHPFTAPHPEDLPLLDTEPLKVRSYAYDIVINGYEVGGGSARIFNSELQAKIFRLLSLSEQEIKDRFGFFIEALRYGTPPHLGIALGLDRLIMLLAQTENIRDVIAFPKTQKGSDLMLQSPSPVDLKQLRELHLSVPIPSPKGEGIGT